MNLHKISISISLVCMIFCGGCNRKLPSCDDPKILQILRDNEMDGFREKYSQSVSSKVEINIYGVELINKADSNQYDCKAKMALSIAGTTPSVLPMSYRIRKSDNKNGFEVISLDPF